MSTPSNTAPIFSFNGDGIVTTSVGGGYSHSVTVQANGKILVAGDSNGKFVLIRYNDNGSLDTGFDGDGIATTGFDSFYGVAGNSVTVQANGKILVAGNNAGDFAFYYDNFALVRYNSNGSLDTGFDGDGKVTTDFGFDDHGNSVAVQANGKILVTGSSNGNFALVRYNSNGSLDTSFDGDGKVTTDFGFDDYGNSVTVQTNGKILVAGTEITDNGRAIALVRYRSNGSLDASFDGDGKVTTDFSFYNEGQSVIVQVDGKILVAGTSQDSQDYDFALVRYNSNGSLDTSFDGDGIVTTDFGNDLGQSVTLQADGKILVAGTSDGDFALVRYNSNGSLDTSFNGNGIVTASLGSGGYEVGESVTVQADGKILVTGPSYNISGDFQLVRYNPDGSLDKTFDAVNTLNGTARYTESGAAVVLDSTVQIYDYELASQGHYNGAIITLARHGGADSQDVFSGSSNLSFNGGNAVLLGVTIGTVSNSNGTLTIHFNSNATQARVDEALSSLAYSSTANNLPALIQIDWTLSDGNSGAQGTGGALTALGSTVINVNEAATNSAPTFAVSGDGEVTTDFGFNDGAYSVIVQANSKILVAGYSANSLALARYNSNGSLDTRFDGDGKVTTDFGANANVTVQADGKILVQDGGHIARYNPNGSLDTGFDADGVISGFDGVGIVATRFDFGDRSVITAQADGKILVAGFNGLALYNSNGTLDTSTRFDSTGGQDSLRPNSITVQADGKTLVAGFIGHASDASDRDFALARYNSDGTLDTSFANDGIAITDFGDTVDEGFSVTVQANGKILVAGTTSANAFSGNFDFALARYNSNGSLDTSFDGDGKVTTDFGANEAAHIVTVQANGKILVGNDGYNIARYNSDGSLDTSFDGDGKITASLEVSSITVQANGKILLAGQSYNDSGKSDFALARYNSDGSLDDTFDAGNILEAVNTLDGTASYIENGVAVVLDRTVQIYDAELAVQGQYKGAAITLARHGGANSHDVFSGSGKLNISGGDVLLSGVTIGTVSNGNGTLTIHFNSNATQARVDEALSSLAYSSTANNPPASVQIDWTFNDGNTGTQGTGGALTALGSTTVNITASNDAPVLTAPPVINYVDTALDDKFLTVTRTLAATDVDGDPLTYGIAGGTDNGDGTVSKLNTYGILTVTTATGAYRFTPNDAAIEPLKSDLSKSFTVTVSDGILSNSKSLIINITQSGDTESVGNDNLVGTATNNVINGLAGDDVLFGEGGNDALYGSDGNDTLNGGTGNDKLTGGSGKDTFVFNSPLTANVDSITDFNPVDDTIRLENQVFAKLTTTGALNAANFVIATAAVDSNDYIIYNKATGALLYDADGSGADAAVQIASLGVNLSLTNADFAII